ncbi:MAG: cytoplasmic protein [Dehalococcoidia bacterium]|jgi:quercetin dioxygenase-like cupin family protein|nr:cytoplasmic protein [Dehalococcoidia bacterium]
MPGDAVAVAPLAYNVLVENYRVRVLEFKGSSGTKTGMHTHPNLVAIAITGGKFKFTLGDGASFEAELEAGQAMCNDAHAHSSEVLGTGETHVLLVELK